MSKVTGFTKITIYLTPEIVNDLSAQDRGIAEWLKRKMESESEGNKRFSTSLEGYTLYSTEKFIRDPNSEDGDGKRLAVIYFRLPDFPDKKFYLSREHVNLPPPVRFETPDRSAIFETIPGGIEFTDYDGGDQGSVIPGIDAFAHVLTYSRTAISPVIMDAAHKIREHLSDSKVLPLIKSISLPTGVSQTNYDDIKLMDILLLLHIFLKDAPVEVLRPLFFMATNRTTSVENPSWEGIMDIASLASDNEEVCKEILKQYLLLLSTICGSEHTLIPMPHPTKKQSHVVALPTREQYILRVKIRSQGIEIYLPLLPDQTEALSDTLLHSDRWLGKDGPPEAIVDIILPATGQDGKQPLPEDLRVVYQLALSTSVNLIHGFIGKNKSIPVEREGILLGEKHGLTFREDAPRNTTPVFILRPEKGMKENYITYISPGDKFKIQPLT